MARIYYLRPGQSQANISDTFSGQQDDTPLTAEGEAQALRAGEKLKADNIVIDRIVCSPLIRTQKTASIVAEAIGFNTEDIEIDQRLTEYDMGEFTGKPRTAVTSAELIAGKGAESPHLFMKRVIAALTELEREPGTILIVAHAAVGNIITCYKNNLDPDTFYDLPPHPNGECVLL